MTTAEIKLMRMHAAVVAQPGKYRLIDGKGRVVMFDITEERATEYLRYYPGGRITKQ